MKRHIVSALSVVLTMGVAHAQDQQQDQTSAPAAEQSPKPATPQAQAPVDVAPPTPPEAEGKVSSRKAEKITVTGSRLKRIDAESTAPVTTFSKEEISKSGYNNVADFIRNRIPSGSMSTENDTVAQSAGSASFAGRDSTAEYTLVLVNGRRQPTNAIAEDYVDINLIPLAAVERIEYLADGASATYGSDAVAGVLNIITKKSYSGTSVLARAGMSSRKDGTETSLQVVSGASSDRSNFLIAGDIFKREPVLSKDRDLSKSTVAPNGKDGRSPNGLPGYIIRADGTVEPFADCPAEKINGAGQCLFDFAPLYQAIPKSERQSIYTIFDHQLFDKVNFFGEARYSRAFTITANAAAPGPVDVSGSAPSNPYPGEDITIVRRYLDFGPRTSNNTNTAFSIVLGLKGEITDSMNWEFAMTKHRLQNEQVGVSGMIHEPSASKYFNDGTLNPFIMNYANSPDRVEAFQKMQAKTFRIGDMNLETYSLTFDGTLPGFELPGGSVSYAFGFENRQEVFTDASDLATNNDEILGGAGGNGEGSQDNKAVFVEFGMPIVKMLDVTLAARNDQIAGNKEATTYNTGVKIRPLDNLMFRASYGTGFKAPGLHYRFLGQSFGVERATDDYSCVNFGVCEEFEINSTTGGNPDLDPESSTYWNFGTVFEPITDLTLNADLWNLKIEDKIGELEVEEILNNPDLYSKYITRVNGRLNIPGSGVNTIYQNLTKSESQGLEIGTLYTARIGNDRWTNNLKINKTLVSKAQTSDTQPLCDYAKNEKGVNGNFTSTYSANAFSVGGDIRYYGPVRTFTGGLKSLTCDYKTPESEVTVKQYAELGLNAYYTAPFGTQVGIGVQNVTDAKPPFDPNTDGNWPWYDTTRYNNLGRYYFVSIAQDFE